MTAFLAHLVVTAALLLLVSNVVKGVSIEGWGSALLAALAFGLVNGFVRPLMVVLTLPFTVLTFGLFLLVVNALMFQLAAAMVPGFHVKGFGAALLASLLLSLLNLAVGSLIGERS
jgi:putative membrane protein